MEIKLELFVRKVRYQLRMKANLDEWTEPEILTQEALDMILDEENKIRFFLCHWKDGHILHCLA